jgi:hypothetical protein
MIDDSILSMTTAFWLIDGLPERWSLSVDVVIFKTVKPLFNLSNNHCNIAESLQNFADCFLLGIPKFLTT